MRSGDSRTTLPRSRGDTSSSSNNNMRSHHLGNNLDKRVRFLTNLNVSTANNNKITMIVLINRRGSKNTILRDNSNSKNIDNKFNSLLPRPVIILTWTALLIPLVGVGTKYNLLLAQTLPNHQ